LVEATCGNGIIDQGEDCDPPESVCIPDYGNTCSYCNEICTEISIDGEYCEDGIIQTPNEVCDGGQQSCVTDDGYNGTQTCLNDCSGYDTCLSSGGICSNGIIEPPEICDGENQTCEISPGVYGIQFCSVDCKDFGPCIDESGICGDGIITIGEDCDPPQPLCGASYGESCQFCNAFCKNTTFEGGFCGDGNVDDAHGEECDDNNLANGDGCSSSCLIECGNGNLDHGEECDDANTVNGDGCSSSCLIECGNGRLDYGEECDDGNTVNGDDCSNICTLASLCGDGVCSNFENCNNCWEDCDQDGLCCGDNVAQGNEPCDGTDNSQCTNNDECFACECINCDYDNDFVNGPLCGGTDCDDRNPFLQTCECAELGGKICTGDEYCPGSILNISDTQRCCSESCVAPRWPTCDECGTGLFNLCDRDECSSIAQGCYFVDDGLFSRDGWGSCSPCSEFNSCTDYEYDKMSCNENICNEKSCYYSNSCLDCADLDGDDHYDISCGGDDCQERDSRIYLGATEVCDDGIDNHCWGDEGFGLIDCVDPACMFDLSCRTSSKNLNKAACIDCDLVAHWTFDEGDLTTVGDSSGDGHHGTATNMVWENTDCRVGNCGNFPGVNAQVEIDSFNVEGDQISITAWIKPNSFSPDDARIISKAVGTGGSDHTWMISTYDTSGRNIRFRLKTDGTTQTHVGGNIVLDEWQHIAAVYDGSMVKIYVNGVLGTMYSGGSQTGSIASEDVEVWIGNNPPGVDDKTFDGLIDDVRIYDKALTIEEIATLSGLTCGNDDPSDPGEECDPPDLVACTPDYGSTCPYCGNDCKFATVVGGICGDDITQLPDEVCDGDTIVCEISSGVYGDQLCNSGCDGYNVCESNGKICGDTVIDSEHGETCDGNSQVCEISSGVYGDQPCNNGCDGFKLQSKYLQI